MTVECMECGRTFCMTSDRKTLGCESKASKITQGCFAALGVPGSGSVAEGDQLCTSAERQRTTNRHTGNR